MTRRRITGPIYAMAGPDPVHGNKRPGVILVADDDFGVSQSLKDVLELSGHQVLVAHDGGEALEILSEHEVDVLVLDMNMPGHDGWTVLREVKGRPRPLVTIFSGEDFSSDELGTFSDSRPFGILPKPAPPAYVLTAVDSAVAQLRKLADARDHSADERDRIADERDHSADERERRADAREAGQDARQAYLDEHGRGGPRAHSVSTEQCRGDDRASQGSSRKVGKTTGALRGGSLAAPGPSRTRTSRGRPGGGKKLPVAPIRW